MTGIVNYECSNGAVSAIAGNGSGICDAVIFEISQFANLPKPNSD